MLIDIGGGSFILVALLTGATITMHDEERQKLCRGPGLFLENARLPFSVSIAVHAAQEQEPPSIETWPFSNPPEGIETVIKKKERSFLLALKNGNMEAARIAFCDALSDAPILMTRSALFRDMVEWVYLAWDLSDDTRDRWTTSVGQAFFTGYTRHAMEFWKPGSSGRPMACYPCLNEIPTLNGSESQIRDRRRARQLVPLFEEVHQRLNQAPKFKWKEITESYRDNPKSAIEQLLVDVPEAFQSFLEECGLADSDLKPLPISGAEWKAIIIQGLQETIKGKSPRREITGQLIARLRLPEFDIAKEAGHDICSGLVFKTLESLHRRFGEDYFEIARGNVSRNLAPLPSSD
jgi:hypothetical protein